MSSSLLHISILLSLLFIYHASSQCSDLDSSTCNNDGYCSLSNNNCVCSKEWNQDIAFIFASSMTNLEWLYARDFASDLLYYGSPSNTRSAIIETISDPNSEPTPTKSFGDEPLGTTINTTLPNLAQSFVSDLFLLNAISSAISLFNSSSSSNTRKVLIIFASQTPAQSPCTSNPRSEGKFLNLIIHRSQNRKIVEVNADIMMLYIIYRDIYVYNSTRCRME